jgi:hypothetical protein
MAARRARVDAGRNRPGPEFFSSEGTSTVDAYVEVLKPGLRCV